MLIINENVKNAYNSDTSIKHLKVVFPSLNLVYRKEQIKEESFKLKEAILDGDSLEFVGCISTYMSVSIYALDADVKGKSVKVYIIDEDTNTELPLFNGYVVSAKKQGYENIKTIECYDALYQLGNVDVTDWYNSHSQTTLNNLFAELMAKCGLTAATDISIPNGTITAFCGHSKQVSQLSALHLLKHICQINGGYGRINRYGKFDILYMNENEIPKMYPSAKLYPWYKADLYPNMPGTIEPDREIDLTFPFYKSCEFDEYNVKAITKVLIRDNENAEAVFFGNGSNKYIIQGNLFAYGQSKETLQNVGGVIYRRIKGISYTPFTGENYGLPFIECGDNVFYMDLDGEEDIKRSFFIFRREMKGIQCLNDTYYAEGNENQSEFLTDLGSQIESLKDEQKTSKEQSTNEIEELKKRVARLEALVSSHRTVTGLIIEKPVREATNLDVVTDTIASVGENNE